MSITNISLSFLFLSHILKYIGICLSKFGSYCVLANLMPDFINIMPLDKYDNFSIAIEELLYSIEILWAILGR